MKRWIAVASIATAVFVGSGTASAHTTKAEQKQEAQVQKIVQGCVSHGNFLTKHGRSKIIACIVPPKHEAAFETCAEKGLIGVHSKAGLEAKLEACAVKNR